nr:iron-containing alcohol dehydrogenase [Rhodococcus trifolii]
MRVRFGSGALASLPEELDLLGLNRVLMLCSPGRRDTADRIAGLLGNRCVGVRADAVMHVPADVAERAAAAVEQTPAHRTPDRQGGHRPPFQGRACARASSAPPRVSSRCSADTFWNSDMSLAARASMI